MECKKWEQLYKGIWITKKCDCKECENKRLATREFYERFDALHNQYMGQGERV